MKLFVYWNWKSALFSALWRCPVFFFTTLKFGMQAALAAVTVELWFRVAISGVMGAATQWLAKLRPAWMVALILLVAMPVVSHALQYVVHRWQGTPNLRAGVLWSMSLTAINALFNWYVMRRGALLTGGAGQSLGADLREMPRLIAGFVMAGPRLLLERFKSSSGL